MKITALDADDANEIEAIINIIINHAYIEFNIEENICSISGFKRVRKTVKHESMVVTSANTIPGSSYKKYEKCA